MLLTILFCIIGFLVVLFVALLVLPFSLSIKAERTETTVGYQIAIRYPWRFLGFGIGRDAGQKKARILLGNKGVYERPGKEEEKKEKGGEPKKKSKKDKPEGKDKTKRKFGDLMQYAGLMREIARPAIQFLKDILRLLKKARIAGDLEVGISDPALMGMLYGFYWGIPWRKRHDLKVKPSFVETTFTGWLEVESYVTLISILYAVIKLAFRAPIIKLIRLRRRRKVAMKEAYSGV